MSLIIIGKSTCGLCGEVLLDSQEIEAIPACVSNEADPLFSFSDSAFHLCCFERAPECAQVRAMMSERSRRTGPGNRKCVVCAKEITDYREYFGLPRLTGDSSHPAYRFNYTHLHKSHVSQWKEREEALQALRALVPTWRGRVLQSLIDDIEAL